MELSSRQPQAFAVRLVDWSIAALLFAILLSWMTGGVDIQAGPVDFQLYVLHSYGALLQLLFAMVLIRWLIQMQWIDQPFVLFSGWQSGFKRFLEVAIAVRIAMGLVGAVYGEVRMPLVRTIPAEESLILIYLMVLIRLLLSRRFGAVTLMISVPASILAVLYGTEMILRMSHTQALQAHYAQIYTEDAAEDEYPIKVAPDYDPSINNGMEWTWGHKVVNNSQGFREKEFLVPKPAGTFRVMVLGDSLTWGAGLSVSERYTDRLAYLIAKSDSDQAVEVLNFGMPGGPTVAEHRHLKKLQADVDPDLIIVGFCINDPQPRGENFSVERSKLHPLYEAIAKLRHLGLQKTYAFIISGIDNTLISLGMLPTWQDALNRIYQPDTFEWQAFENALAGIKEISDQRGLPQPVFITLTQGIAGGFTQHQHIEDWFSKAATAATAKGFVVVDPKPRFVREMEMSELAVNPFDGHPSAKANVIYAEALLKPVLQAVKERRSGY